MAREINLVPDIKGEMIKTLKLRNFILFLCIIVAAASVGIVAILGAVVGGQQLAVDGKKSTVEALSAKVKTYSDLTDFLTIKDQLGNIQNIADNKKVLSRTFGILTALLPKGADTITISELSVNLSDQEPSFTFDAQANAGSEPYIDYNVLDSFKKSMQYMRYDYGRYVDKDGNEIPAYCIVESGLDGATFTEPGRGMYAFWTINIDGCNPSTSTETLKESENSKTTDGSYSFEDYQGQQVVRIWRTPQYSDWYNAKYLTENGSISGIPHFESKCTTYFATKDDSGTLKWESSNLACLLVPGGIDGINITDSSNGKSANEELVLRFSAKITLNPEVYKFNNKHMLAIGPEGRYNVTDSYTQIQAMFGARATDCVEGDTACKGGN
ncbi:hypothetical protein IJH23_03285 [Candidatus Saccharibacteria bacterium]|nr:hypothetical protein [Candidatus Saccharibacteria bacterium]